MELVRNNWIEVVTGLGFGLEYYPYWYFNERPIIIVKLIYLKIFLHLPFHSGVGDKCEYPSYGFYFIENELVLCFGNNRKYIHLPWELKLIRTSLLLKDGTWAHSVEGARKSFYEKEWQEKAWSEIYDFTYKRKNGKVQNRKATITVEEREWRMRFLSWIKLFPKIYKTIEIEFNEEVGEEVNSWKGGVVGCNYQIKKGETPLQTLRRMENERKL